MYLGIKNKRRNGDSVAQSSDGESRSKKQKCEGGLWPQLISIPNPTTDLDNPVPNPKQHPTLPYHSNSARENP